MKTQSFQQAERKVLNGLPEIFYLEGKGFPYFMQEPFSITLHTH